jgi:hypothetical protein
MPNTNVYNEKNKTLFGVYKKGTSICVPEDLLRTLQRLWKGLPQIQAKGTD